MKLYVDLETLQLIEGPGFRNPVTSLRFKRGDAAQLEVTFLEGGSTAASIGNPATLEIQFGIKPRNRYDIGYLVHDSVWTMPAINAESPVYQCSPSFNTLELDSALGVGSSTGTELSEITLMGEITWREGDGQPTSTRTFLVVVENDVNRGTEGVPSSAEPTYPAATSIELITRKGQPNGYAGLDAQGLIPLVQLPPGSGSTPYVNVDTYGVAIGHGTAICGSATLVGTNAFGHGVAIGYNASTPHGDAVAVGSSAMASLHGVAIGSSSKAYAQYCIAIGSGVETGSTHGGQLEVAPIGPGGPRISGHLLPVTGVPTLQFSVTLDHGFIPTVAPGATFAVTPGSLQSGMMTFAYDGFNGNLVIYVNEGGTLKTAALPMT